MVLGVSPDSVKSHQRFKARYSLPFTLLADTDHAVGEAYHVWKQKSMFGKKYMGNERTTYLIDPDGRLARVFEKVDPSGHGDAVAKALESAKRAA